MAFVQTWKRTPWSHPAPGVVRVHLDHLRDPIAHFDLHGVEQGLVRDVARATEGHSAVTLVKHPDLRIVLISMLPGARLGEIQAGARMSVQTVRGHVVLRLPEGPIDLPAGHMAALEREMAHDIEAVEESTVLLTLAWAGASARRAN
jgi:quercetin dioxygenase-like cupin family protein